MTKRTSSVKRHVGNAGFTLIEVMIAVTMLAVVLLSLGALGLDISRRSLESTNDVLRAAEVIEQMNRLIVLPYDSLPGAAGCTTVTGGQFPHQRCITVTNVSPIEVNVQLVVTPSDANYRPDTVAVTRTRAFSGNPLNQ